MEVTVNLINAQRKVKIDDAIKASFKRSAEAVLEHEEIDFPCEIDVKLVSDKGIRELNRDFREVDAPTDVLSFPSGELDDYDEEMIEKYLSTVQEFFMPGWLKIMGLQ